MAVWDISLIRDGAAAYSIQRIISRIRFTETLSSSRLSVPFFRDSRRVSGLPLGIFMTPRDYIKQKTENGT